MKSPAYISGLPLKLLKFPLAERTEKAQEPGRARALLWISPTMEVKQHRKIGHKCKLGQGHERLSPSFALGILLHRKQKSTKVVFGT